MCCEKYCLGLLRLPFCCFFSPFATISAVVCLDDNIYTSILPCHVRASKPWVYLLSLSLLVSFLELKSSDSVSHFSLQFPHLSSFHGTSHTDFMMNINYCSEHNLYPKWALVLIGLHLHLHSCLYWNVLCSSNFHTVTWIRFIQFIYLHTSMDWRGASKTFARFLSIISLSFETDCFESQ